MATDIFPCCNWCTLRNIDLPLKRNGVNHPVLKSVECHHLELELYIEEAWMHFQCKSEFLTRKWKTINQVKNLTV